MHLLHKDFNLAATSDHEKTKLAQLFALRRRQHSQLDNDDKEEQPPSYPFVTIPGEKAITAPTDTHGDIPTALFADPLSPTPTTPEPTEARHLRMNAWEFLSATCYFHLHLLQGLRVGDIHGLWKAIKGVTHKIRVGATIMGITSLKPEMWESCGRYVHYLKESIKLKTNAKHMANKYAFSSILVIHGMSSDPDFKPELSIAASAGTNQLTIFNQPFLANNPTYSVTTGTQLSGNPHFPEICKSFLRQGKCKYEDRP